MLKRVLSIFLLIVISLMVTNKALNLHVHKADNGKIVMHAHPFNKATDSDPVKKHKHSNFEFFFISHLDLLFVTCIIIVLALQVPKKRLATLITIRHYHACDYNYRSLRAPPFFCC